MEAIDFPQSTKTLARPQGTTEEECGPLNVYSDGEYCVSCWQPDWKDRWRLLFGGKVWLWVWSGFTQPPVIVDTEDPWRKKEG